MKLKVVKVHFAFYWYGTRVMILPSTLLSKALWEERWGNTRCVAYCVTRLKDWAENSWEVPTYSLGAGAVECQCRGHVGDCWKHLRSW